MVVGLLLKINM